MFRKCVSPSTNIEINEMKSDYWKSKKKATSEGQN